MDNCYAVYFPEERTTDIFTEFYLEREEKRCLIVKDEEIYILVRDEGIVLIVNEVIVESFSGALKIVEDAINAIEPETYQLCNATVSFHYGFSDDLDPEGSGRLDAIKDYLPHGIERLLSSEESYIVMVIADWKV